MIQYKHAETLIDKTILTLQELKQELTLTINHVVKAS